MNEGTATTRIRLEQLHDGALWRVELAAPKGNVLDSEMVRELSETFESAAGHAPLKAVLLCAAGKHFSFGASVEEHRPEQVGAMLAGFHGLFRKISASGVPARLRSTAE